MDQSALLKKKKKSDCACCSVLSYPSFASIAWLQQVAASSRYLSSDIKPQYITVETTKGFYQVIAVGQGGDSPIGLVAITALIYHAEPATCYNYTDVLYLCGIKIMWFIAQCSAPVRCYVPAPLWESTFVACLSMVFLFLYMPVYLFGC